VIRGGPPYLFVYGTLMRASRSPYAKLLKTRAQFFSEASVPGRLYHLGRFPGAVFDPACRSRVYGEVFLLRAPSLLDALDAYEGCRPDDPEPQLFQRAIVEVRLSRGGTLAAWAYPFAGATSGRPRIAPGRFKLP
jgi:gamma-glutamylcyclotransferase (GGCT)/AIG2-like uncharacterized protein YtfP